MERKSETEKFKIGIIGFGALGIMYGDFFARKLAGGSVVFIADKKRIEKYKSRPTLCNGRECDFDFITPQEATPVDLLVFAVKGNALYDATEAARLAVGKETIILSVMNGIVSEDIIGERLGREHTVYSVAQGMDAVKLGGDMTYSHMGQILLGLPRGQEGKQPLVEKLKSVFDKAGFEYTEVFDIERRMWAKWMLNVGVNQVVMVEEGTYGTVQKEGAARELMKEAMREVIKLSEFEGINLTKSDMDALIALLDTLDSNNMPSMRQDGIEKRASEVELFAGRVMQKARKYNLEVPANEYLYKAVKAKEGEYVK